eukprot:716330-Rhodomonas_salina.1
MRCDRESSEKSEDTNRLRRGLSRRLGGRFGFVVNNFLSITPLNNTWSVHQPCRQPPSRRMPRAPGVGVVLTRLLRYGSWGL